MNERITNLDAVILTHETQENEGTTNLLDSVLDATSSVVAERQDEPRKTRKRKRRRKRYNTRMVLCGVCHDPSCSWTVRERVS